MEHIEHQPIQETPSWLIPLNIGNAVATLIILVVVLVGLRGQAASPNASTPAASTAASSSAPASSSSSALNSLPQQVGGC